MNEKSLANLVRANATRRLSVAYRDAAIRESRRQGLSIRQIAQAHGLAPSRVHAILRRLT